MTAGSPPSIAPSFAVVPPISNVSRFRLPSSRPMTPHIMTPAAGPDSTMRIGMSRASSGCTRPAFDCMMKMSLSIPRSFSAPFEIAEIAVDDGLYVGIRQRGAEPLELAHLGRDFGRQRDRHVRVSGGDAVTHHTLVAAVCVSVDEGHRRRLVAAVRDRLDDALDAGGIDGLHGFPVDVDPFVHLEHVLPVDQRYRLGQIDVEGIVPFLPAHDDDVAEPPGRDEGGPRSPCAR